MVRIKGYVQKASEEPEPTKEEEIKIERFPLGVQKLDEGLEGGIPVGSWVVISGEPGTGKTVLTQHASRSALERKWNAVIVSTETKKWEWLAQARSLGLPLDKYPVIKLEDVVQYNSKEDTIEYAVDKVPKDSGVIFIDTYTLSNVAKIKGLQTKAREKEGERKVKWYSYLDPEVLSLATDLAFRVFSKNPEAKYIDLRTPVLFIVDSLSVFYLRTPNLAAKIALDLALRFKKYNTVGLLITQYAWTTGGTYGARVEHIADGVIHMWMENVESTKEVRRHLIIKKMRMTQHALRAYRVYIEKGSGMRVEPE